MPAFVIYINGHRGVGKLTVANALQNLIPNSQILHNHELIDPVERICPRGTSAQYLLHRAAYRQKALQPIATDPALRDTVFIFADSHTDSNECVSEYTDLALGENGRRFYSVILHCELEENVRRLTLPRRGRGENGKLTNPEVLRRYRSKESVWKFGDEDEIEIDGTEVEADVVAERIWEFVRRREREGRTWVDPGDVRGHD